MGKKMLSRRLAIQRLLEIHHALRQIPPPKSQSVSPALNDKISMVESGFLNGVDNGVCSDLYMENLDILDFPMESLEGDDGLDDGNWDEKLQVLGPIPSEDLVGSSLASGGNNGNTAPDVFPSLSLPSEDSSKPKPLPSFQEPASRASTTLQSIVFQTTSPISVLESSSSCLVEKSLSFSSRGNVPVRSRTKRSRSSSINSWLLMGPRISSTSRRSCHLATSSIEALSGSNDFSESNPVKRKVKKKKKLSQLSSANEMEGNSSPQPIATKRCSHCQVTKTPQWREGPMGPKTLCNACGVRYRSGRLFPEYRPMASPTFIPSVHSNCHKKVIEMRNKGTPGEAMAKTQPPMSPDQTTHDATIEAEPPMSPDQSTHDATIEEAEPPMSPPPEFIPMSSYLYDCILGSSEQYF